MSAAPKKHGGWADDFKKSSGKRGQFESIEKERFISSADSSKRLEIPEIDEIQPLDDYAEPPTKSNFTKELDVDLMKNNPINMDDKTDLSILIEALEAEEEIDEPDEVWHWNQLFTNVTGQISDGKK